MPDISPNYLSTEEDRRVAVESLRLVRRIVMESKAFSPYNPVEVKPGALVTTDSELIAAAGDLGTTIFHPVGSCKMGVQSDPLCVLSSDLKVRGIGALRVVDASVMPQITSGNTAAPTMALAARAANLILRERK